MQIGVFARFPKEVTSGLLKEVHEDGAELPIGGVVSEALPTGLFRKCVILALGEIDETEHPAVQIKIVAGPQRPIPLDIEPVEIRVAVRLDSDAVAIDVQAADTVEFPP